MNTKEFLEDIETSFKRAFSILKKKNADYADEDPFKNFRYAKYVNLEVEQAILVRVSDKFARVNNLIRKGKRAVKDETIEDTLIDMINYLAILNAWLKAKKGVRKSE